MWKDRVKGDGREQDGMKALRHRVFQVSVILKGLDGLFEAAGGVLFLFASPGAVGSIVRALTQRELSEDPHDIIANALVSAASHLSVNVRWFAFLYLVSHGAVKAFLAVSLLERRRWSYPAAIVFFALFIVYQLYRYALDSSVWWLVLTAFDLLIILLTWFEYRAMAHRP